MIGRRSTLLLAAAGIALLGTGQANATRLFKGVAVITARTATNPACVAEYDIGQSIVVEYLARVGAENVPERFQAIGPNGSLLLISNDATPSLRGAGTASLSGNAYTNLIPPTTVSTSLTATPAAIAANTNAVTITTATVQNLGIPACTVTIRAALTYFPPGGV